MRDPRVVEVLSDVCAADRCQNRSPERRERQARRASALRDVKLEVTVEREEEHSAWMIGYKDPTNATRYINTEFLSMPEFRRLRALVKQIARYQYAAFHGGQGHASRCTCRTGAIC